MSYRLKLTKARSYTRGSVTATQEKPFVDVEDAGTAEALLSSGYFSLVSSTPEPDSGAVADSAENPETSGNGTEGTVADRDGTEGTKTDSDALSDSAENPETDGGVTEAETAEAKPDYEALSRMSKTELTAYAKERSIDISKCKTKSDILTAISMACGGSPTMIDLQRDNQGGDNE